MSVVGSGLNCKTVIIRNVSDMHDVIRVFLFDSQLLIHFVCLAKVQLCNKPLRILKFAASYNLVDFRKIQVETGVKITVLSRTFDDYDKWQC